MRPWLLMLLLPLLVHVSSAARILGINPTPSISHQLPFLIIMRALAERGHQVTIITTDPMQDAPPNTTQIDISFTYDKWKKEVDFYYMSTLNLADSMEYFNTITASDCEAQFESPALHKFIQSPGDFDLVVMELFMYWCYFGLVHRAGSPPVVSFWSAEPMTHLHHYMGNLVNPAYMPTVMKSSFTDHMTFWERAVNAYRTVEALWVWKRAVDPHEKVMRNYFGNEPPNINTMVYNTSLLLVNNHFCSGYAKPMLPNMIQMTGLHIAQKRNPLPKEIRDFLDGADHGVIYFSLGSNVKSNTLPEATKRAFTEAFSVVPQRVIWKFESDLPGKPKNVMISKWLQQQDILAHPNVRLFITQGGLQSFNEASYFGVPLIGIPFFGDQEYNVAKMVKAGIGVRLSFTQITKESMLEAIQTVLESPRYQENMKQYSAVYREHQNSSLENAVWWVEYVIRHKGAPHLRTAALVLEWWQLLLLDVIGFIVLILVASTFILYKTACYLLYLSCYSLKPKKLKIQ